MMLKWIHAQQTATEIGTGSGSGCECETETKKGKGTGTGPEKETETEIGTENVIVIVTEIVLRGGMVAESVPLEVRVVEGAHEERLATEIGR